MKYILVGIIIVILFSVFTERTNAQESAYAKSRVYLCESVYYGVDYSIQEFIGKRFHCRGIWDRMYRQELLSFNIF